MKVKYKNFGCYLMLKVKCGFGERIQYDILEQLVQKELPCFLKTIEIKNRRITYRGIKSISLNDYLWSPITRFDFLFILAQFVRLIKSAEDNYLPLSYISYDLNNCFLTESTKELQLVFLPIKKHETRNSPNDFIEALVYSSQPVDESGYISAFAYFYRKQNGFNARTIERYIEKEEPKVFQLLDGKNAAIPFDAGYVTANNCDDDIGKCEQKAFEQDFTVLGAENLNDDTLLGNGILTDGDDTFLGEEDEDTLLGDISVDDETVYLAIDDSKVLPSLRRISTNEVIKITKTCFRIGAKETEVDYVVRNNNTISKSHADIMIEDGKYFVYDLSSKNKTYVNNRVIPVQTRVQIYPQDIIRLSNEDFVFYVE